MARNRSRLKLGYYPLVPSEGQRIRSFLEFPTECAVLDPCAGTGAALRQITGETQAHRHGIELDSYRAVEAAPLHLTKSSKEASSILTARSSRTRCCT